MGDRSHFEAVAEVKNTIKISEMETGTSNTYTRICVIVHIYVLYTPPHKKCAKLFIVQVNCLLLL